MKSFKTYLFVSGMFRSGTTLLARLLNTHSDVTVASDIMLEFFRSFRNELYQQNNYNISRLDLPIENNFKTSNYNLINKIENQNFNLSIQNTDLDELFNRTKKYSNIHSEIFSENLKKFSGNKFSDILEQIWENIQKSYSKNNEKILGFKSVWCDQFVPSFLNHYSTKAKAVFIIRDPRGVIGSNYARDDHRYPLEFLIRHWRKSVYYAILCSKIISKYSECSILIRYEDLLSIPESTVKKLVNFLGIEFEKKLLEPTNYLDGKNEQWIQNTNTGDPSFILNPKNIEKWKKILPSDVQKFIEFTCFPEMKLLDYKPEIINSSTISKHAKYPPDDYTKFAAWIKEFYPIQKIQDTNWFKEIENQEKHRIDLFRNKLLGVNLANQSEIQDNFLDNQYFEYLTNNLKI